MRLINTHTLELEEFFGADIPKYAILSHTWGSEEVLLADWAGIVAESKELGIEPVSAKYGYGKIKWAIKQAVRDDLDYLWVDTNCIDKPNWSELAEAINSMFAWYRDAVVCYAYLEDLTEYSSPPTEDELRNCRWFTRGWTLQELLAPEEVNFYSHDWTLLGSKKELADAIKTITGIPKSFITGRSSIYKASLAQRMSWVARRITTRPEDIAYCMLGILDVNMPLIYGEGYKAFIRLQEEIIKSSADESLFCWTFDSTVPMDWVSVLAPSPSVFRDSSNFEAYRLFRGRVSSYSVTNQGLSINLPLIEVKDGFLGLLNVLSLTRGSGAVGIFLQGDLTSGVLTRSRSPGAPIRLPGSLAVISNYLMPVEHTREHIFIRSKIGSRMGPIKPHNTPLNLSQTLISDSAHQEKRHQVLILTEGQPFISASTSPLGRLTNGCILNIQTSKTTPTENVLLQLQFFSNPATVLLFGVDHHPDKDEALWFCKALGPHEGDLMSFSDNQLKTMTPGSQISEQLRDESREDVKINLSEEFDAGEGCRMRVAHISIGPGVSGKNAGADFGLGLSRFSTGNIWQYAKNILDKDNA